MKIFIIEYKLYKLFGIIIFVSIYIEYDSNFNDFIIAYCVFI